MENKTFFGKLLSALPFSLVTKEKAKAISLVPKNSFRDFAASNKAKQINKPSNISFDTLRKIAKYDALIRICVNSVKKSVSQSRWKIKNKDGVTTDNTQAIQYFTNLFSLQNSNNDNMRLLLDKVLEDLLILDAGVIEKIKNPVTGEIVGLNSVDGATIRPVMDNYGDYDGKVAFQQIVNGKVMAEFSRGDLIYIMQNPQNDLYSYGYGLSPIESILIAVQASLEADMYNARSFSEDNIPPGVLDLGNMSEEEAQNFIAVWNATVIGDTQKLRFLWGSDSTKKYFEFGKSNKDMQFVEYIDWLSRIKLATYGLTGIDANITQDVNRSTADAQLLLSNARGVQTVKRLLEEYITREILADSGYNDIEFVFDKSFSLDEQRQQAEIDEIKIRSGVLTADEVRERDGLGSLYIEPVEPKEPTNKNYYPPIYP